MFIHVGRVAIAGVLIALAADRLAAQPIDASRPELRLTLREAVARAAAHNLDLAIEQRAVSSATDAVVGAEGAFDGVLRFRPLWQSAATPVSSILMAPDGRLVNRNAGGTLSYEQALSKLGSRLTLDFDNGRVDTSDSFAQVTPYYTSRLSLSVAQPLLRGLKTDPARTQVAVRRNELKIASTTLGLQLSEVIGHVEDAYWDLVGARQEVDVRREAVALGERQVETNGRLVRNGALAPVELVASESELERRRDDLYRSTSTAAAAGNRLKLLLGSGVDDAIWREQVVPIDSRPADDDIDAGDVSSLLAAALEQRLELREITERASIAAAQKRLAADQKLPDVSLIATYGHTGLAGVPRPFPNPLVASLGAPTPLASDLEGDYSRSLSNMFGRRYESLQVGLSIDLHVRDRSADAAHSQAVIAEDQLRLERRRIEQIISQQVRDAAEQIASARQRVAAADASQRAASEKLDSETRMFEAGESTNFMVLTRQNELAMSRLRRVLADLDLNRALARLRRSIGSTTRTYGLQ
jgi:hydrophobic/amphiphilic exporter-1 (mainly G- bacteria), HAE1 family